MRATEALGAVATCEPGGSRTRPARRHAGVLLRTAAVGVSVAILLHGVDLKQAGDALATADARWLLVGVALSLLSVSLTAVIWGMLLHKTNPLVRWPWIAVWHARAMVAGQLIPTGTAGDAVRVVAGRPMVGTGPAVASTLVSRLAGGLGLGIWAVTGAVLLRDALGRTTVVTAVCLAGVLMMATALILVADLWVDWLGERRWFAARRVHGWLAPIAAGLGAYRRDGALLSQCLLLGLASWGLNLAALTALGHAVGADAGWQLFAVVIPVTLTATLMPLSVNGIGFREGILISLLGHAGVASAQATALAILVDVQMLPFAGVGALLWLGRVGTVPRAAGVAADLVPVAVVA